MCSSPKCGGSSKVINREAKKEQKVNQILTTKEGSFKIIKNASGKIEAVRIPQ